jgi:hypothetical protein
MTLHESARTMKPATHRPRSTRASLGRPVSDDEARQVEQDLKAIIDDAVAS